MLKLFKLPDDEWAVLRIFLKMSCLWPENMTWWKKLIQLTHWPIGAVIPLPFMLWFCATEAFEKGTSEIVQGTSDCIAMTTFIVRGVLIIRRANDIYNLTKVMETHFKDLEVDQKPLRVRHSKLVWCPTVALFTVDFFSFLACATAMAKPPEQRETSAMVHSYVVYHDWLFYIVFGSFVFSHWHIFILNTVTDALIISTTTMIQGKVKTLKELIKGLGNDKDTKNQDIKINNIIKYHTLILTLHKIVEGICRGPLLVQFFFLVVSLGSPGYRLIYTTLSAQIIGFLVAYLAWVTTQLSVYCLVCDEATHSCMSIGAAIYYAYNVTMDPRLVKKMVVVMGIASRPLNFTARGILKVNRKSLLKLVRRSYSFYSAILNLQ